MSERDGNRLWWVCLLLIVMIVIVVIGEGADVSRLEKRISTLEEGRR